MPKSCLWQEFWGWKRKIEKEGCRYPRPLDHLKGDKLMVTMRKGIKKLFLVGVLLIMSLGILGSCTENSFNAEILNSTGGLLNEYHRQNSAISGVFLNGEYIDDENLPRRRVQILKSEDDFEAVPTDFDFERQMFIRFIAPSAHPNRELRISTIRKDGDILRIELRYAGGNNNMNNARPPERRVVVIRMDRIYISYVEFTGSI